MQIFRFPFKAMACACEIVVAHHDFVQAQVVADKAIAEVRRIERKFSRYQDESILSQINQSAGMGAVAVDAETWNLLEYAENLFQSSEGLFDITSGILRRAWNFSKAELPSERQLESLCALIDWRRVERFDQQVRLPQAGMEIDFGGFGKEYASDRAGVILIEQGIRSAYVNLGGDIRVLGPKPDGQAWQIGIQDPRELERLLAAIPIERGALATSGDYERYFDLNGQRFCHILNPHTGQPVNYWRSITAMAALTTMAGSCTTIAMLMQEKGLDFLQKTGVNFLAVDHLGRIFRNN